MEKLWAPWRIEIIKKKQIGCFFCEYIKQNKDKKNLIIERSEKCFVIMNRYPYNNGHLMIVPYEHKGSLLEINSETRLALMDYTAKYQLVLQKTVNPHGFNIGINVGQSAGAGVKDHLHIHIVPRWDGDTNFMPVLGNTKVINQSLKELYDILKENSQKKECSIFL